MCEAQGNVFFSSHKPEKSTEFYSSRSKKEVKSDGQFLVKLFNNNNNNENLSNVIRCIQLQSC